MPMNVSTSRTLIQSGNACCQTAIHELESAAQMLERAYVSAGSGFRDSRYREFGAIIEECWTALRKPIGELEGCSETLEKLLKQIEQYESI